MYLFHKNMAGHKITFKDGSVGYIHYADGNGEVVVNGRKWRWDYHDYLGATFLRADGQLRKNQCPTSKAVWDAYREWLELYESRKKNKTRKQK